ncbi:ComEA family DNA-binding protein [Catenulispora yoronensis]
MERTSPDPPPYGSAQPRTPPPTARTRLASLQQGPARYWSPAASGPMPLSEALAARRQADPWWRRTTANLTTRLPPTLHARWALTTTAALALALLAAAGATAGGWYLTRSQASVVDLGATDTAADRSGSNATDRGGGRSADNAGDAATGRGADKARDRHRGRAAPRAGDRSAGGPVDGTAPGGRGGGGGSTRDTPPPDTTPGSHLGISAPDNPANPANPGNLTNPGNPANFGNSDTADGADSADTRDTPNTPNSPNTPDPACAARPPTTTPAAPPAIPRALGRIDQASVLTYAPHTSACPARTTTSPLLAGTAGPTAVIVDVEGKVARPGVLALPAGSRVYEALAAAGGALPGIDASALDLARLLTDGEQLRVGIAGEPSPAVGVTPPTTGHGKKKGGHVVNLNTATLDELQSVPDVGPAMAQRILDWRSTHGHFTSVNQLRDVRGIGDRKFAEMRDSVTV